MNREATTVIPVAGASELAAQATRLLGSGYRLALVAAHHDTADHPGGVSIRVVYLFVAGPPDRRVELHLHTDPRRPHVPSLAALSFPCSRFEREMHDLYGIEPDNHPKPRPLIAHPHWPRGWHPMHTDAGPRPPLTAMQPYPFLTVEGDGVYEIPVGPVHAGLIEPGHFRFSVVGETILKLKIRLWYLHKGIEKLFAGRTIGNAVELAERVSGDTAIGHNLAYCLAVEDALGIAVPAQAQRGRAVLLELERLHNHVADIGALRNDVAYGIAHAHTQRIREQLLRLNAHTTGHRLLRGAIYPGGTALHHVPDLDDITRIAHDLATIAETALQHTIVRDRFTGTAVLTRQQAADVGALGYVARASGLATDARQAHPLVDLDEPVPTPGQTAGDVLARFRQRVEDVRLSITLLHRLLPTLRAGVSGDVSAGQPLRAGTGIVEGWRGTIVHRVETGLNGEITRVKIVDPSFFNWPALPLALADTIVPDFPLVNKSFNLAYAGNDL